VAGVGQRGCKRFKELIMKIPIKLPIEVGKKYYLRDGRLVQIYNANAGGEYPIHGAIYNKETKEWSLASFTEPGRFSTAGPGKTDIVFEEWIPQDKELVWCWNDSMKFGRVLRFYDAKNNCVFDSDYGKRNELFWSNYAPYVGEYPEWAEEALKELED
jgi:hypothetical protein